MLGAGAAALVMFGRALRPRMASGLMAGFVVVDVLVFTVLCVVEVGHGISGGTIAAAGASAGASPGSRGSQAGGMTTAATAGPRPVSALGFAGRFAIYDPDLLDTSELSDLDPPDVNAIIADPMPSVQGYSSTVDGRYAAATGSHQATGGGQDTLAPRAVADGTLDQLGTSVLLTPAEYLVTSAAGGGPAAGPAGTGRRDLAAGQRVTWYLGRTLEVAKVEVPDAGARRDAAAGIQLGLTAPDGSTQWFRARAMTSSALGFTLPGPVASVAVIAAAPGAQAGAGGPGSAPSSLGPPTVSEAGGDVVVADGQLADAVVPPHWTFAGFDGSFAVFANRLARPPLSIQALGIQALGIQARAGRSAAGAWVTGAGGTPTGRAVATVFSRSGARVVRSVSDIPGWSATWQPRHGPAAALAVQRDGLVQAVDVPGRSRRHHLELYAAAVPGRAGAVAWGHGGAAGGAGLAGRWADPGAHDPATPTAALSASRAADWRAASARSNGPAQASPTWWRRFVACRHSEAALARMKSRYSGRAAQVELVQVPHENALELRPVAVAGRGLFLAGLGEDARRHGQVAQRRGRDGRGLLEVGTVAGDLVQHGEAADDHALVVGPGRAAVVHAAGGEPVVDQVARADQPAGLQPPPLAQRPLQVTARAGAR